MRFEILLYLLISWPAAWEWRSQQWLQLVCSLHSLQVCSKGSVMPRVFTWYKALKKDFFFHFFSGHHRKRRKKEGGVLQKWKCPPILVRKTFACNVSLLFDKLFICRYKARSKYDKKFLLVIYIFSQNSSIVYLTLSLCFSIKVLQVTF